MGTPRSDSSRWAYTDYRGVKQVETFSAATGEHSDWGGWDTIAKVNAKSVRVASRRRP